ncbi:hypothetical protein EDEG_02152 [Edhazardia aedis USNM 41457]|uniref:Uncharacterized protein n=1 Tax=Edhazardia aedis (strain USNM 41457) TaxID=1003232 RepID=J9D6Y1_EDHAE|nr:hypothetical protein EDEG_02152 [Edhazardia aedis USNM 41457]|eukprot:EJW03531.1 hypothetical protein EDEG_02152 [Edhazardia aedis USNM 41457]
MSKNFVSSITISFWILIFLIFANRFPGSDSLAMKNINKNSMESNTLYPSPLQQINQTKFLNTTKKNDLDNFYIDINDKFNDSFSIVNNSTFSLKKSLITSERLDYSDYGNANNSSVNHSFLKGDFDIDKNIDNLAKTEKNDEIKNFVNPNTASNIQEALLEEEDDKYAENIKLHDIETEEKTLGLFVYSGEYITLIDYLVNSFLLNSHEKESEFSCIFYENIEYSEILQSFRDVYDKEIFKNESNYDHSDKKLFYGDGFGRNIIFNILSNHSIHKMLKLLNTSKNYNSDLKIYSKKDLQSVKEEFGNFRKRIGRYKFLPIFTKISNFKSYKYTLEGSEESENLKNDNTTNSDTEKDSKPFAPKLINNSVNVYMNKKSDYILFWAELNEQVEKLKKITLDCTHPKCKRVNSDLIRLIANFNFAICLNDNNLFLDSIDLKNIEDIQKCFKKSIEYAFISVLINKKPQVSRSSMRFSNNLNTRKTSLRSSKYSKNKTISSNKNSKDSHDIHNITFVPIFQNSDSIIIDKLAEADSGYKRTFNKLVDACKRVKLEKLDVSKLFNDKEKNICIDSLSEDIFYEQVSYLNAFFEVQLKNFNTLCKFVNKMSDFIYDNTIKIAYNIHNNNEENSTILKNITYSDLYEIEEFIDFVTDSIRYIKLKSTPEIPYNLQSNQYNIIDHKLASIRYFLLENNEEYIDALYKPLLRLRNIIIYIRNGSPNNYYNNRARKKLISAEDFERQLVNFLYSNNLEIINLVVLKAQIEKVQIDNDESKMNIISFRNMYSIYKNDRNSDKYKNLIQPICIANMLNHPMCCLFEPDV